VVGGGFGWWDPWWSWGPWWYYPPAYYPPRVVVTEPPVYIERPPDSPEPPPDSDPVPGFWYFCQSAQGYYPDVQRCPERWIPVPPRNP
jgi:hypothetical protein